MRQNLTRHKLFYINANKKANICKKHKSAMQKNKKVQSNKNPQALKTSKIGLNLFSK